MRRSFRLILVAFLFSIFYFLFSISFAQSPTPTSRVDLLNAFGTGDNNHDGSLDDLSVSGETNTNPTKAYLTDSASAGQEILRVTNTSGFNSKDEVAIIQMQGANAGAWETAYVVDVRSAGGKGLLLLNRELANTFTVSSSPVAKVQVVKIPHYNNLTVASGGVLTTPVWDGNSGGVLFVRVKNNFTVEAGGKVDVSGTGFRGGVGGSGVSMQCGDYMYCSAGTSCWPYSDGDSVIYECRTDRGLQVSDPNGEGPAGVGGRSGATGNQGWSGDTRMTGGGASRQYYRNGGGGGGGAGGGGAGGSLASSTSANGQDGGSGSYGESATSGCSDSGSPTRETYPATGETILRYYYYSGSRGCMNECKKFESNGEVLYSINYSCSRNYTYYETQNGPPGRGRPGGAGGTSNAVPDFSGNKILLGVGGGAGGAGAIGGSGGGGVIGGYPGTGGSGGYGGGAVVIFAKTINVAGEIVSNGRGGQPGTNGGDGARGYNYGCNGDCAGGGGAGGAGGGGGGGGSGGTIRLYGETATVGTDRVRALGAVGAAGGAGGSGGAGGYSNAGGSGSGGTGGGSTTIRGGTGSNGAVFVTYKNSFSGSNSNPNPNIQTNQVANITKQ